MKILDNPFFEELVSKIRDEKNEATMGDWVCKHTTLGGQPYSFKNHEFQREILNDMHDNMTVIKVAQVGLTECSIRKAIGFLVRNSGTSVMYTFADLNMKKRNAATRIKPILTNDFPAGPNDSRSMDVMQIGNSFLYVSGNTESDMTSSPCDMIINDELDLSDMENVSLANSRLQHSRFKIRQKFSTPTFTGYGVSLEYENLDQREYFFKCPHCNCWQVPMYNLENVVIPNLPSNVDNLILGVDRPMLVSLPLEEAYVCCKKCRKRIDVGDSSRREWVAKYPERIYSRGYRIRPFSSNLLSVKYISTTVSDMIARGHIRRAYNTILGEEYNDGNARLDLTVIKKCFVDRFVPDIPKDKPVYLGLDMGITCHLTLVTNDGNDVILFEPIPHERVVERVSEILKKYNVVSGVVDRHPFIPTAEQLRDMSNGVIQPVVYTLNNRRAQPIKEIDGKVSYYNIDRTLSLDDISQRIKTERIKFYGYGDYEAVITTHLRDMYRDEPADSPPRYMKMNGNDHFYHSLGYALTAIYVNYVSHLSDEQETPNIAIGVYGQQIKPVDNFDILSYNTPKDSIITRRLG